MNKFKFIRIFLVGMLCGVTMAAALTFSVAIPATNDHWRVEVVKRGGATWYFDKNGHLRWMWTVEPVPDVQPVKKVIVVPSAKKESNSHRL